MLVVHAGAAVCGGGVIAGRVKKWNSNLVGVDMPRVPAVDAGGARWRAAPGKFPS